jgi:hypothetical protein
MASFDYTFTSGDTVTPTKLNAARNVKDIVNADIKSDAAIALSKLATGALPAAITVSSDNLVDGTIVNADINASAAIAGTKVAPNFGSQNITTTGFVAGGTSSALAPIHGNRQSASAGWAVLAKSDGISNESGIYVDASNNMEVGVRPSSGVLAAVMRSSGASFINGGNLGVGTTIPTSKLTVEDNSSTAAVRITQTGSGNALVVEDSANPDATPFVVTASGDTGVGTASPTVKLDVNGGIASSTAVPLHIKGSDFKYITCESDHLAFYKKAGAYDFYFRKSDDGTQNGSNTAELMIIKDSGNVGIGTPSPSTKLEVNGTVTATAFSGNVTGNLTGTASAIADGSVSTAKIVDGNVTLAKLVAAVQESLVPVGAVQAFAMNSAPAGWLAADGSNVNRTTYAALFTAIGTTYGVGDGSTTFALPDLRGYFVRGSGTNSDGTAAGTFGTKQADDLKSHTHSGSFLLSSGPLNLGGTGASILAPLTVGSVTDTGGAETRPKNIAMLYCIKF